MKLKKADFVLVAIVVLVAVCVLLGPLLRPAGAKVLVKKDGKPVLTVELQKDGTYPIGDGNRLTVENGMATMTWADCPDGLCVQHTPISKAGQSIVCLPNRVVITIEGGEVREVDGVTE